METVTNSASGVTNIATGAVTTASRAIWGDGTTEKDATSSEAVGTEPISGETGDVKAGEPYDKGNLGT
jgi:hypothetical protein